MALYTKQKVTGIDIKIQNLQSYLYTALKTAWGIGNDTAYNAYGRSYMNETKDGIIPEVYYGFPEYKEVLFDDTVSATSFFGVNPLIKKNPDGTCIAQVFLIFMVNMKALEPSITDSYPDEIIHTTVQKLCYEGIYNFTKTGFLTGKKDVFREYTGIRIKDGTKYRDMAPLHCFRINFNVIYSEYDCN